MVTIEKIKIGTLFTNNQIASVFNCSTQGGMRRSHRTNTLVILSDHTKLYEDRWEGDIFYYTGMGKRGDQSLSFAQNKTLAESNRNAISVHLFEVLKPTEYIYMGRVALVDSPYQDEQFDEDKSLRRVWVFPLKLVNGKRPVRLPLNLVKEKELEREKLASKLSEDELFLRAKYVNRKAINRSVTTKHFERNPFVSIFAKRWANGICQLCNQTAPYKNKKDQPHLHTHHIQWLSKGGEDSIENTIALCPNCHDKMHIIDDPIDVKKLKITVEKNLAEFN